MGKQREYGAQRDEFGRQVMLLRTRVSLTQSALAEQIGVHRRSIQNWEAGLSYPKVEALQRLIVVFLYHRVFTAGNEYAEAGALWERAAFAGPHELPSFDREWFAQSFAASSASTEEQPQAADQSIGAEEAEQRLIQPAIKAARQIIDWGEAIALTPLYGRAHEVETLFQQVEYDRCRVIAVVGLGGIGKSSLAITVAQRLVSQFDVVMFRSLQNGPSLSEVLDQLLHVVSGHHEVPPQIPDKINLLVQSFRERRCLLILDNFEAMFQAGVLSGSYRGGYAEYGMLLQALCVREHQSCLIITSREKPVELGPFEGRLSPVQVCSLNGLDDSSCERILTARDIVATADEVSTLARLYGGNPLALQLVTEPIRELFAHNVSAFLAEGTVFFGGLVALMRQQCMRSTPVEHAILDWLAIEREPVSLQRLLTLLGDTVPRSEVLLALESLRRRKQIELASIPQGFTLQPVILEFVTSQLIMAVCQQMMDGQLRLLHSHALVLATARDYVRRSQERLIATPILERLSALVGGADAVEQQLFSLLAAWRHQPLTEQGYGPGNILNLLRLLRGHLRELNLTDLGIRQAYLQGIEAQDTSLARSTLQECVFSESFDALTAIASGGAGLYWAAAGRRGGVRVWKEHGTTLHLAWRAHTDLIYALAFSPDGRMVASGSWDGTLKVWDVASGTLLWSGRHQGHVNSLAFAPNGSILASAGDDALVRLWAAQSGTELQVLPHQAPIATLAWSPRGHVLASGDLQGVILFWQLNEAEAAMCVRTIAAHPSWVDGLAYAPDGSVLASAGIDGTVKLWDMMDGHLRQTLAGHTGRVTRVAWSPDGHTLASGGLDQTIMLWEISKGRCYATLRGHAAVVVGLAFTPDGRSLLSGSEDGSLRLWDLASRQCAHIRQGYATSLYDVDWSPDGTALISAGSDALVTIFDLTDRTPLRLLYGHSGVVFSVGWSPDDRWLCSSEWDNTIRLWNPLLGHELQILQHPDDPDNFFYGVAWSGDGQRLAAGTFQHGVVVFELAAQRQYWLQCPAPTFIRRVAWSPSGALLAGGGDDGTMYVWDAEKGMLVQQLIGHSDKVTSLAWSVDGARLASSSGSAAGGELLVWELQTGYCAWALKDNGATISALVWAVEEDVLISGDSDGRVCWWNVAHNERLLAHEAHQGTVQSLRRSPDGTKLASCGNDGAIVLWDLRSCTAIQTLRRDRPYERLDITGLSGLTDAQRASLIDLGAVENPAGSSTVQLFVQRTSHTRSDRVRGHSSPLDQNT